MMSYNSPSSKGEGSPGGVDCMRGLGCRGAGGAALAAIAPEAGGKVKKNTGGFPRGEPRAITATHIGHDDALAGRIAAWRSRCVGSRGGSASARGRGIQTPTTFHRPDFETSTFHRRFAKIFAATVARPEPRTVYRFSARFRKI